MKNRTKWLTLAGVSLITIALAAALMLPGVAYAQGPGWSNGQTSCTQNGFGWQGGMMGRIAGMFSGMMGRSNCGGWSGSGMMGGGMMGGGMMGGGWSGGSMMGGFGATQSGPRITLDEAHDIAQRYAESYSASTALAVKEVMEFEQNFYAEIVETDSGISAFEILIDPVSGYVHPEPGPNMMWNSKYGMHSSFGGMMGGAWGFGRSDEMTVTPEQAITLAQRYLDQSRSGLSAGDEVDPFYGYYTLHTLQGGEIAGMLSVNGYTGQVWYHSWHGDFIGMTGDEHD